MTAPARRKVTRLRNMVMGERPDPMSITFTDAYGQPLDNISGWAAKGEIRRPDATVIEYAATVADSTGTMDFPQLDQAGTWYLEMWVGDGSTRYASDLYVFDVGDPLATPAI